MHNRTMKDWSAIDPDIRIKDVLKEMVDWVINREVMDTPFIAWLSIGQIQWGNGYHFKQFLWDSKGLNWHMGYREGKCAGMPARKAFYNATGMWPPVYPEHYFQSQLSIQEVKHGLF